jgi:hypothetical protein
MNDSIDAPNPEDVCGSSWILALLFQFCLWVGSHPSPLQILHCIWILSNLTDSKLSTQLIISGLWWYWVARITSQQRLQVIRWYLIPGGIQVRCVPSQCRRAVADKGQCWYPRHSIYQLQKAKSHWNVDKTMWNIFEWVP